MKLGKQKMLLVSFMLFSLFFGAGNLIFPPFLGKCAGSNTLLAWLGFLITAVALPVMGVEVVAKFNCLEQLSRKVHPVFAIIFTIAIYLSIGPGLGIPRAASVPFEMAIAPYLPESWSFGWMMLLYSSVFFILATWLALTPNKLVDRIGRFMTPTLLCLLLFLFLSYLVAGQSDVAAPQEAYLETPFVQGFLEGYNTMDAIAALNFGLVIATTLRTLNVKEEKSIIRYTVFAGLVAGTILATIYGMLSFLGMKSSAIYTDTVNGAETLRYIVHQVFGAPGATLLAATFTLACLTTCVGLITSISQYFSTLTKKISYRNWVFIVAFFSFCVCNQGLNVILGISIPVLNMVYPVAIVLIVLGLLDHWLQNNPFIYPCTIAAVSVISILYAIHNMKISLGFLDTLCNYLPFYELGMGWVPVAICMVLLSFLLNAMKNVLPNHSSVSHDAV